MKLRDYLLEQLGAMVVGDHPAFPYRSSMFITQVFERSDLPYRHDGSTRPRWASDVLKELNLIPASNPDLPSDGILRVIFELFQDEDHFDRKNCDRAAALIALNEVLKKQDIEAYFDEAGSCYLRNKGTGATSRPGKPLEVRPLSKEELKARDKIAQFLDTASEDEFTEKLLVPYFQRLGFHRVSPGGHQEKLLEYGKDLWMKFQLPTGHWIYFCAQIKKGKIDAKGTGGNNNVTEILNQTRMAIDHPIFDPDTNLHVLLDHVFIISAGDITRPARNWIGQHLNQEKRRHVLFMDRAEFLEQSARILRDLDLEENALDKNSIDSIFAKDEDLPF